MALVFHNSPLNKMPKTGQISVRRVRCSRRPRVAGSGSFAGAAFDPMRTSLASVIGQFLLLRLPRAVLNRGGQNGRSCVKFSPHRTRGKFRHTTRIILTAAEA